MSITSRYRDFMRLLERWPLEPTKTGRDIGERIRDCVKVAFNSEQGFVGDLKVCERQYKALTNLVENKHLNAHKRNKPFSSTGLTAEECKLLLSNESLKELENQDKGFFSKLFKRE